MRFRNLRFRNLRNPEVAEPRVPEPQETLWFRNLGFRNYRRRLDPRAGQVVQHVVPLPRKIKIKRNVWLLGGRPPRSAFLSRFSCPATNTPRPALAQLRLGLDPPWALPLATMPHMPCSLAAPPRRDFDRRARMCLPAPRFLVCPTLTGFLGKPTFECTV